MLHRIINVEGCNTCNQVLLSMEYDENRNKVVKIIAWHQQNEKEMYFQSAVVSITTEFYYDENKFVENFIKDFSQESALSFLLAMNFQS